jgi:hypothetical protein
MNKLAFWSSKSNSEVALHESGSRDTSSVDKVKKLGSGTQERLFG